MVECCIMKRRNTAERRFKKVLVAMDMSAFAGRKKFEGITEFLSEGRHWSLQLLMADRDISFEMIEWAKSNMVDGMILLNFPSRQLFAKIGESGMPAVVESTDWGMEYKTTVQLFFDSKAMTSAAAEHFLSKHMFRSFGFVHDVNVDGVTFPWSKDRHAAFAAIMSNSYVKCKELSVRDSNLARKIAAMPRPAAILAANDSAARVAARAATAARLSIPEDVAILGSDDNQAICEGEEPELDSIAQDFCGAGRMAAALLEKLMDGSPDVPKKSYYGIRGISLRGSSTISSPHWPLVQRALEFIDANACSGVCVPDVSAHLGISRRLLDLRFREILGRSVLDSIRERRLEEVKNLLATTDMPISRITAVSGFSNANHLKNVFKRQMSQTMRNWRASSQSTKEKPLA